MSDKDEPRREPGTALDDSWLWLPVKDGDPRALAIMRRHYSWRNYRDGRLRRLFVGPGEKMVLLTPGSDAVFVWRKFISDSGQQGVNCAAFRNEGDVLSSDLVRQACELAWQRWPGQRLYTYVNPRKVKSSNPGCCFLKAGWRKCGASKGGLVILEKLPDAPAVWPWIGGAR
jgi:hypothetical protein